MTHITTKSNDKIDIVSVGLKGLLIFTFLFIYGLLLFGSKVLTVEFIIPNYILLIVAVIVWLLIIRFVKFRAPLSMSDKTENIWLCTVSVIVLGIQAFITYNIIFRTSWDVAAVWYGSHWAASGDMAGIQDMSEYYSIYPNNLFLVYLFSRILKLNMLMGSPVSNGGLLLALVQCAVMNVSGIVLFKCAKRFVSVRASWCIYFLYVLLIDLSGWMVLPYSDGMGVIFPILFLYLYLRCKECPKQIVKYLYVFALFVMGEIAYHIKPYTVVVLIAITAIELIEWLKRALKRTGMQWKNSTITVLAAIVGLACSSIVISQMTHSMGFSIDKEREMGIPHYLMLGVNVDSWGGYSDEDLEFGKELGSKELRNRAELEEFKSRLKNMGIAGYAELFVHKAAKNYLDGTYSWRNAESFYEEIYPSRGRISDILRSCYYGFGELFPYHALIRQFLWIGVLTMIPFAALTKHRLEAKEKVLMLSVLGLMLYLQIFEAQARYVFVFVPLFLILEFIGSINLRKLIKQNYPQTKQ